MIPAKLEEAVRYYWGERCPTFNAECPVCQAWAELDSCTQIEVVHLPADDTEGGEP